ncbi:hypothetical protein BL243_12240 [Ralstonia solanacearum]|nr:hypothetical protein BL243_12240 [Ralstonia solanacearum]
MKPSRPKRERHGLNQQLDHAARASRLFTIKSIKKAIQNIDISRQESARIEWLILFVKIL